MKYKMNRSHAAAVLLGLLLLSATALTACNDSTVPEESETVIDSAPETTDANDTAPESDDGTSPDDPADSGAVTIELDTTPVDPDETRAPVMPELPDEPLIGDGVELAGPYATFSRLGGVYTDTDFSVELTAPAGYTVRYTTDGSLPTANSTKYESPITFTQSSGDATVIRAACYNSARKQEGQVITQTYVTARSTEALSYTVMISTDQKNLNAMYSDVHAKVERPAHVEIVAPNGERVVSQDVGLRLFGGSSRGLAQKSFKIIARKDGYFADTPYVGAGTFTYPFFPERVVQAGKNAGEILVKYDGLVLRNGGNDSLLHSSVDPLDACLLRDGIANEFVYRYAPHVGASLQHFAVVYLNGEYYGVLELRENQNEDYVKRIWGVDDNDVVVIKSELDTAIHCDNHSNGGSCRFCGVWFYYESDDTPTAQKELQEWISLCKKAAGAVNADEATYRKVFEEISQKIDLENVKEYLAVSCFLCNKDWPYNNVRLWKYTGAPIEGVEITDGRFRFATRDMDMSFGRYSSPDVLPDLDSRDSVDMFAWVFGNYVGTYGDQPYPDALWLQGLFSFLLRDDGFRADFAEYCRLIASDEAAAYLKALYADTYAQVKPIVNAHIKCWSGPIPGSYNLRAWQNAAGRVEAFIEDRPAIFLKQLNKLLSMYK